MEGWMRGYWHSRANMIAAGTNEIQRNVIAARGLGLAR
jgi:alkylation response protein AidB-like acyl-CoA dehydrogenase